jgi:hypothetical protein
MEHVSILKARRGAGWRSVSFEVSRIEEPVDAVARLQYRGLSRQQQTSCNAPATPSSHPISTRTIALVQEPHQPTQCPLPRTIGSIQPASTNARPSPHPSYFKGVYHPGTIPHPSQMTANYPCALAPRGYMGAGDGRGGPMRRVCGYFQARAGANDDQLAGLHVCMSETHPDRICVYMYCRCECLQKCFFRYPPISLSPLRLPGSPPSTLRVYSCGFSLLHRFAFRSLIFLVLSCFTLEIRDL